MHEAMVSRTSLAAGALWAVAAGCLVAAGAVFAFAPGAWRVAAMLAATSCLLGSVAATATVRGYTVRTCALIRASAEVTRDASKIRGMR